MPIPLPTGWKTFTDGDGDCSTPPIPPEPVPTSIIKSDGAACDQVFEWNADRETPVIWTVPGPLCGVHSNHGEFYDTALVLKVNSSPACYGMIDVAPPLLTCERSNLEGYLVFQAAFRIEVGTPRFGICAWIPLSLGSEHVTLFGLIVDVSSLTIGLYVWTDLSLLNLAVLPSPLYVTPYVPVDGDVLSLTVEQFPSFPFTGPIGDVYDSSNNFRLELPTDFNGGFDGISVTPLARRNWHVGFLAVGSSPAGTAVFFPSTVFDNCGVGPVQHTAHLYIEKDVPGSAACTKVKFSYHYITDMVTPCPGGAHLQDILVEVVPYDGHNCGGLESGDPSQILFASRGTIAWTMTGGPFNCPGFCSDFGSGGGPLYIEADSTTISNCPACCPGGGNPNTGCCGPGDGSTVHIKFEYTPNDPAGQFVSIEFDIDPAGQSFYVPAMDYISFRSPSQITNGCCPCSETLPQSPVP